jgi:hypothetical protein
VRVLAFVAGALTAALWLSTCHMADALEAACIKGRIGELQAAAVNRLPWQKSPNYCAGSVYTDADGSLRYGSAQCEAGPGDRILAASCAQALRSLASGD